MLLVVPIRAMSQETGHQSRKLSGTGNETQFNMADGEDETVLPGKV